MRRAPLARALGLCAVICLVTALPAGAAPIGATLLVDRPSGNGALPDDGVAASRVAGPRSVSADGTFVVVVSDSDGLDPAAGADRNRHCYLRNTRTGTTALIDRADGPAGTVGNGSCTEAAISADGSLVAFTSLASNLVPGDTNGTLDVFVRTADATFRASVAGDGSELALPSSAPDVTRTGSGLLRTTLVSFQTAAAIDPGDANGTTDVYVRRIRILQPALTTLVSRGGAVAAAAGGYGASMTADGQQIAFITAAPLDAADPVNGDTDAYVRDVGAGTTVLASRPTGLAGKQDGLVYAAQITRDGSGVAFITDARNLGGTLPATTSRAVYLRRFPATTTPVSVADGGGAVVADGAAASVSVSDAGSWVAFESTATNLGDGAPAGMSVHVRDVLGGRTLLASRADGAAGAPAADVAGAAVSGDGGLVMFSAPAPGIVAGDTGDSRQVFSRNVPAGTTRRVSRATGPDTAPAAQRVNSSSLGLAVPEGVSDGRATSSRAVSADGRYVVFSSQSDGLLPAPSRFAQVLLRDMATGETRVISRTAAGVPGDGDSSDPVITPDGATVAFASRAPALGGSARGQVLVWRRETGALSVASATPAGQAGSDFSGEPSLSDDGSRVAFVSQAANLGVPAGAQQVLMRSLATGGLEVVSRLPGASGAPVPDGANQPAISGDGARVAFATRTAVPGSGDTGTGTDVYVRDLASGETIWASRADAGRPAVAGNATGPSLNGDGTVVAFASAAPGLTADDPDAVLDVFTRNLPAGRTVLQSRSTAGLKANQDAFLPIISRDGTRVAFVSAAPNLVGDDLDGTHDVFLRDAGTGQTTAVSRVDGPNGTMLGALPQSLGASPDLACVAFESNRPELVPGGHRSQDFWHVYLRAAAGPCAVPPPGTGAGPGTTARATVSRVSLRPARFRPGTARARGTILRFTLDRAATVTLVVERPTAGRRRGRVCIAGRRTGTRCTARVRVGSRVIRGAAGANTVRFTGVFARRALRPGVHRLRITPEGGTPVAIRFTVLR